MTALLLLALLGATPCDAAVRLDGPAADVARTARALEVRGIARAAAGSCAAARATLRAEAPGLVVELERSGRARGTAVRRAVSTPEMAAVVIEAWVRRDLGAGLLRPMVSPPQVRAASAPERARVVARAPASTPLDAPPLDAPASPPLAASATPPIDAPPPEPAIARVENLAAPSDATAPIAARVSPEAVAAASPAATPIIAAPRPALTAPEDPGAPRLVSSASALATDDDAWSLAAAAELALDDAADTWLGARATLARETGPLRALVRVRAAAGSARHDPRATTTARTSAELLLGAGLPLALADWVVEPTLAVGPRLLVRARGDDPPCAAAPCAPTPVVPDGLVAARVTPTAELGLSIAWRATTSLTLELSAAAGVSPWADAAPLLPAYATTAPGGTAAAPGADALALAPEPTFTGRFALGLRWEPR